jgi:hypothetical protein
MKAMMRAMTTRWLVLAAAALVIGTAIGPSAATAGPAVYVVGISNELGTLDLAAGDFSSTGTLNFSSGRGAPSRNCANQGNRSSLKQLAINPSSLPRRSSSTAEPGKRISEWECVVLWKTA